MVSIKPGDIGYHRDPTEYISDARNELQRLKQYCLLRMCALRTAFTDKILRFINTVIIIIQLH